MSVRPNRLQAWLGSLPMAVGLLLAIGAVLAWGTIYEARFGTAAVQRFVYQSWWFQGLLAFLAVNLAVAACERYPWQRRHLPFVLAHIGIILILFGGILGGRFGIDGQLIIREGEAERVLQLPDNLLTVRQTNPGVDQVFPTRFQTQAWAHEPNVTFPVTVDGRDVQLTVDHYYPDAVTEEGVTPDGDADNPAVQLRVEHEQRSEELWLFATDPERFGASWGQRHLLFLAPAGSAQMGRFLNSSALLAHPRGVVTLRFQKPLQTIEVPVPDAFRTPIVLEGTPYRMMFKDYFPDFAITEHGPASRSEAPRNPAVSFTLTGPEGTDAHVLFALHPEVSARHGWAHTIKVEAGYTHPASERLPSNAIAILRAPDGKLAAILTGPADERQVISSVQIGTRYTHPWLGDGFEVVVYYPRANVSQHMTNRGNEVKAEALHLIAREGNETAEAWLGWRGTAQLAVGKEPLMVAYRPDERELPFTVQLLDFRKTDYPGTEMAAGFESDVRLTDAQRGLILMRTISMNHPLRYRGYSLYQSSYIPGSSGRAGAGEGSVETTVLAVRNDPGTPFVYAGFLIVIGGVVAMFTRRSPEAPKRKRTRT